MRHFTVRTCITTCLLKSSRRYSDSTEKFMSISSFHFSGIKMYHLTDILPNPPRCLVSSIHRPFLTTIISVNVSISKEHSLRLLVLPVARQKPPKLTNCHPLHWQHAVLQTIQILPMNRRDELAGDEAQKDTRRQIMLAYADAQLVVLCESLRQWKRYGLSRAVSKCL